MYVCMYVLVVGMPDSQNIAKTTTLMHTYICTSI